MKPAFPAEPKYLNPPLLMGALQVTPAKPTSLWYKAETCLCARSFVRFNSSKTAGRGNMTLGTIDYCLGVGNIRGFLTS